MTEHPILFSGPMVQAILDERKTQTRRVVQPQPWPGVPFSHISIDTAYWFKDLAPDCTISSKQKCSYGQPGDWLWVRETWQTANVNGKNGFIYRADPLFIDTPHGFIGFNWKPSIHMPRRASRITLEVTNVRVERVQDISEKDCFEEGIPKVVTCPVCNGAGDETDDGCCICEHTGRMKVGRGSQLGAPTLFCQLWDSTNAKRGYPWEANPWVWVLEFKRII